MSGGSRVNRRVLALSVVASCAAACAAVLGIDDPPLRPDADADAGADAGPPDPCVHARPPGPPDKDDGTESIPPFYLALRTCTFLGDKQAYDLDGVCTCAPGPGTAADGAPSCTSPMEACDEEGGVDNRATAFFSTFTDLFDIDRLSAISSAAAEGQRTVLLHIAEYNGTANDTEVRIGVMTSRGILDGSGCGTVPSSTTNGVKKAPAGWCGHDKWTYSQAAVVPGTLVPIIRLRGWVRDGVLAFAGPQSIPMLVGEATVSFATPTGAGRLFKDADGMWRLEDAVLAGRVPMTDLLAAVGMLPTSKDADAGRKPICLSPVFGSFKTQLCAQPDIRSQAASDFQPGACDAVSAAASFTAGQADLGAEFTPVIADNPCAPDQVEAGVYDCP